MLSNIFPFFCLLLSIQCKLIEQIKWLDDINYNSQMQQVILLITGDRNNVDPRLEEIVPEINRNFPILNYQFHDVKLTQKLKHLNDPQSTIFIIIHQAQENENLEASLPIYFINELPKFRSRPKCLVILLGQAKNHIYKKFFQNMWTKKFLDVTLLEIVTRKQEQNSLFLNNRQEITIIRIQNYNPFTETVKVDKYRSAAPLFPEKLRNMHGYPLKIGFYTFKPEVFETYDQSGHATLSGLSWWKIETLSSKMNFRIIPVKWNKKGFLNCTHIEESTGMFKSILNNEVDFLTVEFGRFYSCDEQFYTWSKGCTNIELCLVVPFIEEESYSLTFSWKILNLLAIVNLPILVWCVSHFLEFDSRNWRMTYITQMFLGSSVPKEPQRLAERIIFIFLLITCLLNSSFIYTAITDIGLQKTSRMKYQTVNDVLSHNIEIIIGENVYNMLYPNSEGDLKLLMERAKKIRHTHDLCVENFIWQKNIACLVSKDNFQWRLQGKRDNCGKPVSKLLKCFRKSPGYTVLASRSPYNRRVDTIVQKLLQSGIPSHWRNLFNTESGESKITLNSCESKREESIQVLHQIFFILVFGYSCSILAFIYEQLVACLLKRKASNFKIGKYLPRKGKDE